MSLTPSPERRLMLCADMQRYSLKSNLAQLRSQQEFVCKLDQAAGLAGLERSTWRTQPSGDGQFCVLPHGTSESTVIAKFVTCLDALLRPYNRDAASHARIRVRVALHTGLVHEAANGYAGEAVVTTARLVDTPELKAVLDEFPDAGVALIVSEVIYRDVVDQRYEGIRPERFREVRVKVKEYEGSAWIYVPDEDVNQLSAAKPEPPTSVDGSHTRPATTGPQAPSGTRSKSRRNASTRPGRTDSHNVQGNTVHGPLIIGSSGITGQSINLSTDAEWDDD